MTEENIGQGDPQGEGTGNGNWQPFLDLVPTDKHSQAQEILANWDKGVQERFTSRAREVEPYKPFIDNKIDPRLIDSGVQLMEAIRTQPQEVFKALAEQLGTEEASKILGITPATTEQPEIPEELKGLENHPKFQELQQMLEQQNQQLTAAQQQAQIDQELENIANEIVTATRAKFGDHELTDFEEQHITFAMLNGMTAEQAVDSLIEYRQQVNPELKQKPPAPNVLSGQGRTPNASIDPAKMTDSQRKHTAADFLRQMNAANQDKG
jgi:hypothetical protein